MFIDCGCFDELNEVNPNIYRMETPMHYVCGGGCVSKHECVFWKTYFQQ